MNGKRLIYLALFVAFTANRLGAQNVFHKIVNDNNPVSECFSIQPATDGGYVLAGGINSPPNQLNAYLIKVNSLGNVLWAKQYGGASPDMFESVENTSDGGYILAGTTGSFGAGSNDVYLVRTDSAGDTLWTRVYGGAGKDKATTVRQCSDGGFIVAGYTESFGAGMKDMYLVRTDSTGDTLWTRTFGGQGTGQERCYDVRETADSGFIAVGQGKFFTNGLEVYVVRTDAAGDTLWTRAYATGFGESPSAVIQTSDGGYAIVGWTFFVTAGEEAYLIKLDSAGGHQWSKAYGGNGPGGDFATVVVQLGDGGYVIAGYESSFPWPQWNHNDYLIRTDSLGDTLWTRYYGVDGNDLVLHSMAVAQDGGYMMMGIDDNQDSVYLVKADSLGNSGCPQREGPTWSTVTVIPTITSGTATIVGSGGIVGSTSTLVENVTAMAGDACDTASSVNDEAELEWKILVYPNPTTGQFVIKGIEEYPAEIFLFDITGRMVYSQTTRQGEAVDVSHLPKGLYLYQVKTPDATVRGKLVKQ